MGDTDTDTMFNIFGDTDILARKTASASAAFTPAKNINVTKLTSMPLKGQSPAPASFKKKSFLNNDVSRLQFSVTKKDAARLCVYEDREEKKDQPPERLDDIQYTKPYREDEEYFSDQDQISDDLMDKYVFGLPENDLILPDPTSEVQDFRMEALESPPPFDVEEIDEELRIPDFDFHDDDDFKLLDF